MIDLTGYWLRDNAHVPVIEVAYAAGELPPRYPPPVHMHEARVASAAFTDWLALMLLEIERPDMPIQSQAHLASWLYAMRP